MKREDRQRREWRLSLAQLLAAMAAIGVLLLLAKYVEPPFVAGALIGGGCGALIDAWLRRRRTSLVLAFLLFGVGLGFASA